MAGTACVSYRPTEHIRPSLPTLCHLTVSANTVGTKLNLIALTRHKAQKTQTRFERFEDCSCQSFKATSLEDRRRFERKFCLHVQGRSGNIGTGYQCCSSVSSQKGICAVIADTDRDTDIRHYSTTRTAFCVVAVLREVKHGCCIYSTHRRTAAQRSVA